MTGVPAIRSELAPRAREAVTTARARLAEAGALEEAVVCWRADEHRRDGLGRKPRATDDVVAERRAVVAVVLERALRSGDGPLTSRGAAYALETLGLPKTREAFRRVEEAALALRDSALVPWEAVADGSRRVLHHGRFADPQDALEVLAENYRRDLWAEAPIQVQVWVEKAGIASALAGHTHALGVDLLPARGFSGAGFVRAAIADAAHDPRPLVLLLAGDGDSSGARALEAIERRARRDGRELGVEIEAVERWAVTREQVARLGLPMRPDRPSTHRRDGDPTEAVELDAMPLGELRAELTRAIDRWCPPALREAAHRREVEDRALLARLARAGEGGA
jgi:hypothetical protein